MRPEAPRKRGTTRWLLLLPTAALAAILGGVVVLEAAGPRTDVTAFAVPDVPPLGTEEARTCTRSDRESAQDIREEHRPGSRVSSTQVYLCPSAFDGVAVTYAGELVGELIRRDGGVWVQVNDDGYALEVGPATGHREHVGYNTGLSVWLPDGLHEQVEGVGRPGRRGDVVLLAGTILRADPADGGGTTLRAEDLTVLAPTVEVEDPFHTLQAVVAGVLAVAALVAVGWARAVRRR